MRVVAILAAFLLPAGCAAPPADDLLIRGATVIDPASATTWPDQCVAINGARVTRLETCNGDETAERIIDGYGKWLLPGYADMHVHALWDAAIYAEFFDAFLDNGVTRVRDMASTAGVLAEARAWLLDHDGPDLLASGPVVDGPVPLMPTHAIAAGTAADARDAVARLQAAGADFVKPYTLLPRDAALEVAAAASELGLPVGGHLPSALTAADAIAAGFSSIEHMAVGVGGLCNVDDAAACRATLQALTAARVYLVPTLLIRHRRSELERPDLDALATIDAMPPLIADDWRARRDIRLQEWTSAEGERARAQYAREQRLTELAIEEGALLMAGTDAGDLFVPPGRGLHDELALLVAAGMPEMQALQAATSVPAEFLGRADEGRVSEGAVASLVLLNSNPLDDIRNSRDVHAVILHGRRVR